LTDDILQDIDAWRLRIGRDRLNFHDGSVDQRLGVI
jgi:hypothetical protein